MKQGSSWHPIPLLFRSQWCGVLHVAVALHLSSACLHSEPCNPHNPYTFHKGSSLLMNWEQLWWSLLSSATRTTTAWCLTCVSRRYLVPAIVSVQGVSILQVKNTTRECMSALQASPSKAKISGSSLLVAGALRVDSCLPRQVYRPVLLQAERLGADLTYVSWCTFHRPK